jgi:hypothetical protein
MIPIDIVNKILVYVGELNNSIIITQYNPITNKEYYKINFHSDLFWRIKSTLIMKRHYPIHISDFHNRDNIELYKYGIPHYENQLRSKQII